MPVKHLWVKSPWTLLIGLGLLLVSLAPVQQVASGQNPGWTQPLELSSNKQSSAFPDILADSTGKVHVFWSSSIGNYDVVMYRSLTPGKSWTNANDIAALSLTSGRIITRPSVLVTPNGLMYMTYRNFTLYDSVVPIQQVDDARAWSKKNQISGGEDVVYFGRMVMDSKGTLHLFYTQNTPSATCSICFYLYYRKSIDGGDTWTDPKLISDPNNGVAKPQILVDPQDKIHVVWEAGLGGDLGSVDAISDVVYVSSSDGGDTWTVPVTFRGQPTKASSTPVSPKTPTPTPTPAASQTISGKDIALGRDGKGNLIVAWLSIPDDILYYSISQDSGGTWSPGHPIPGLWGGWTVYPARTDDYSMATDSSGAVHLVLSGRTRPELKVLSLLHVTWDGKGWSAPEAIKNYQGDVPEWPRIAVGNGNQLHVVWFERDKAHIFSSDTGLYTIWYAQGLSNAPSVAPVEYPTSAVTPIPTGTALPDSGPITPTVESIPTLQNVNTPSSGIIGIKQPAYSETDYLTLLAKTLIPSLFFLGLIILGIVIYRRR